MVRYLICFWYLVSPKAGLENITDCSFKNISKEILNFLSSALQIKSCYNDISSMVIKLHQPNPAACIWELIEVSYPFILYEKNSQLIWLFRLVPMKRFYRDSAGRDEECMMETQFTHRSFIPGQEDFAEITTFNSAYETVT